MKHFFQWLTSSDPPFVAQIALVVLLLASVTAALTLTGIAVYGGHFGLIAAIWIGGPVLVILVSYLARGDDE